MVDGEEQLVMLRDFDTVFLVDDSGSMAGARWREAKSAIDGVVHQAIKYDEDGIDIYFLNSKKCQTRVSCSASAARASPPAPTAL